MTKNVVNRTEPTDEELMLDIRQLLLALVVKLNVGQSRGIKTNFQIKPHDPSNPQNPEGPYTLISLDMIKRFHTNG